MVTSIDEYSTLIRIVATILFILGSGIHLLAFFLSYKASKKDARAFVLLIQIDTMVNALNIIFGWLVLNTVVMTDICVCFISLGFGALIGPKVVNFLDSLTIATDIGIPLILGLMMLFRAFIIFQMKIKKFHIILACFIIFLICFPQIYISWRDYQDISSCYEELDDEAKNMTKAHTSYCLIIPDWLGEYFTVTNYFPAIIFVLCLVLRFLMAWKLRKLYANISDGSRKLHSAFLNLLTLDTTIIFSYFILQNAGIFEFLSTINSLLATFCQTFPYTIFTIPSIVQGFALLYFIPYLRKSLILLFKKQRNESSLTTVIARTK